MTADLLEAARRVLAGLDRYVPDFCDPCTRAEQEALRVAIADCDADHGNRGEDAEHAAAAALHARERDAAEREVRRLRAGLARVALDIDNLATRIGLQDLGSPWAGELGRIAQAAAALLESAAVEGGTT